MNVKINELLQFAVQVKASDIHLAAGDVPAVRIDGVIRRMDLPVLTDAEARRLAYSIMNQRQKTVFEKDMEIDFSIGLKGLARFRVNVFTQASGVAVVLRLVPTTVPTLEQLKAPHIFKTIANLHRGLVLVTGPTGSGKSTTLAAIIDHINQNRSEHIVTIEDPIEFVHTPKKCIINQREVGAHTHSFANALRSSLREDPDVVLVGELRDLETISMGLSAAETGHLVFGTLHTNSAPETIDRIVDSYPAEEQAHIRTMLSISLQAVISQVLVHNASGPGRVAVHEVMIVNQAIRNLIRENKIFQIFSSMQAGGGEGMQTMDRALKNAVAANKISRDQAIVASGNPRLFDAGGMGAHGHR